MPITETTDAAPTPIGPYSLARRANGFVFVSGQTPIDPRTQRLANGGVGEQTEQCLNNVASVLASLGLALDDVIRSTVYLRAMGDFQTMNGAYARRFPGDEKPARTTIAVAGLPLDALVEIEVIAAERNCA